MPDGDATAHVPADEIAGFIAQALIAVGLPPDDATSAGGIMARTDLLGADGHGVFRLPKYVARLRAGGVNPRPNMRIDRRMGATAVLDGDNGMGQLVMQRAAHLAVEIAREHGVGWVGAHHSNHAGAAAPYAMIPLEAGMIGIYVAVGSANHLPRGRVGDAAEHQPDRGCDPRRGGAPRSAGHGHHRRRLWQGEARGAARRDHAGRLDD